MVLLATYVRALRHSGRPNGVATVAHIRQLP
jgi:hypothetical protein